MSADKVKIDALLKKVDDLVVILNDVQEDLKQVSASLKSLAVRQITQPVAAPPPLSLSQPATVAGAPRAAERSKALEDAKTLFPDDLEGLLSFEEKDEYVIIKPRQFLGSDNFSKIASAVRQAGGEYISAGKGSHFRIPKKNT